MASFWYVSSTSPLPCEKIWSAERGLSGGDGPRLVARGAVGLADADPVPGRRLLEGRDDLAVGVLRRGVRNEVDRAAGGRPARGAGEQCNGDQSNPNRSHSDSLSFKFLQGSNGD